MIDPKDTDHSIPVAPEWTLAGRLGELLSEWIQWLEWNERKWIELNPSASEWNGSPDKGRR